MAGSEKSVVVALRATYQAAVPTDARGNAMALSNCINCLSVVLLAALLAGLRGSEAISQTGRFWLLAALAAAGFGTYCRKKPAWANSDTAGLAGRIRHIYLAINILRNEHSLLSTGCDFPVA